MKTRDQSASIFVLLREILTMIRCHVNYLSHPLDEVVSHSMVETPYFLVFIQIFPS